MNDAMRHDPPVYFSLPRMEGLPEALDQVAAYFGLSELTCLQILNLRSLASATSESSPSSAASLRPTSRAISPS
jgi:hypothetical protein